MQGFADRNIPNASRTIHGIDEAEGPGQGRKAHTGIRRRLSFRSIETSVRIYPGKMRRLFPDKSSLVAEVVRKDFHRILGFEQSRSGHDAQTRYLGWVDRLSRTILSIEGLSTLLIDAINNAGSGLHPIGSLLADATSRYLKESQPDRGQDSSMFGTDVYAWLLGSLVAAERLHPGHTPAARAQRGAVAERLRRLSEQGILRD